MKKIERIYAEKGVVRTVVKKDGLDVEGGKAQQVVSMTPGQAAARALALNRSLHKVPEWHRKDLEKLIERIIEVCREARHQQEAPSDKETEMVTNMLHGKTATGIPLDQVKFSEDYQLNKLQLAFHTVAEEDIKAVYRNNQLTNEQKSLLLGNIHAQNLTSINKEALDSSIKRAKR